MTIQYGKAPCGKCGRFAHNIPVDPDTKDDDGLGGYWLDVVGDICCPRCGEPFIYYHVPAPSRSVWIGYLRRVQ